MKIAIRTTLILLIVSLLLFSCSHKQEVCGNVIDTETKLPIDSVYVYRYGKMWNNEYTDSVGYFKIKDETGLPIGHKHLRIIFEKLGYYTKVVKFQNMEHLIIELEKIPDTLNLSNPENTNKETLEDFLRQ
jgi:hypothetical protein